MRVVSIPAGAPPLPRRGRAAASSLRSAGPVPRLLVSAAVLAAAALTADVASAVAAPYSVSDIGAAPATGFKISDIGPAPADSRTPDAADAGPDTGFRVSDIGPG